jgi:oligopeptide/dipeptide ABC transporter ATP-binding protein
MIAMALSCSPKVLLADEPTTALDVTIQAQILELMVELQKRTGTAIVFITHDLGVIAETAHRVVVMYAGRKVEEAAVDRLFADPLHPYTVGLLHSMPSVETGRHGTARGKLEEIPGMVPPLHDLPPGCRFAARCSFATDHCRVADPPLVEHLPGQWAACWHTDRVRTAFHG